MTLIEGIAIVATTVTTMLALYGIDAWLREHAGKRRVELAEDAPALFYEAADVIANVRSPIVDPPLISASHNPRSPGR